MSHAAEAVTRGVHMPRPQCFALWLWQVLHPLLLLVATTVQRIQTIQVIGATLQHPETACSAQGCGTLVLGSKG